MTGQIIYAGYAIPNGIVKRDFAVYVEGHRIITTGTRTQLTAQYPDAPQIGGEQYIMTPGFVNAHDHGRALGTQSLGAPDAFLEVWLNSLGSLPTLPPYLAAAWEGLQLVKSGVTGTAHSHNPQSWDTQFEEIPPTLHGYAEAGVRVAMHPVIIDQNPLVYADTDKFMASLPEHLQEQASAANQLPPLAADDYFAGLTTLYEAYHDAATHRVHIQPSPAGGQWCSDELTLRAVDWARARNTRVQMHMLETRYQRHYAYKTWGKSFIQHLDEIGVLGDWLTLAHMVWADDEDQPIIAHTGAGVAHNPSSNLRLRSGVAPVADMLAVGVTVGIGMDGQTLDDDQDYLREMRLAWTLAQRPGMASEDVLPAQVMLAGTKHGAAITFGKSAWLGSLEANGLADLVLLDWNTICGPWTPDTHPTLENALAFFLRRANRSHVRHVMSGGEWVLKDGAHTRLDEAELAEQIQIELASQLPTAERRDELGLYIRQFYKKWDQPEDLWR